MESPEIIYDIMVESITTILRDVIMEAEKIGIENIEKAITAIELAAKGSAEALKVVDWNLVGKETLDLDSEELKQIALKVLLLVWSVLKDYINVQTLLMLLLKTRK
jgi:hypothetical protein